jgi:hypothetical protein
MNAGTISTVVIATLALLGMIGAGMRWLYTRGGQERSLADTQQSFAKALDDNTLANRELTAELRDFKDNTLAKLQNHEVRITVLERVPK